MSKPKYKIGDKIKFIGKKEYNFGGEFKSHAEVGDIFEITSVALAHSPDDGFVYSVKGSRAEKSPDWLYMEEEFELVSPKQDFVINYEEPEEDEFTDNCLETCKPGKHVCKK